jgi:hypothetical protein
MLRILEMLPVPIIFKYLFFLTFNKDTTATGSVADRIDPNINASAIEKSWYCRIHLKQAADKNAETTTPGPARINI